MQNGQNLTKRAKTCRMRKNVAYKTKKFRARKYYQEWRPQRPNVFAK